MDDLRLLIATFTSVFRGNKGLRVTAACAAGALVLVLALVSGVGMVAAGGTPEAQAGSETTAPGGSTAAASDGSAASETDSSGSGASSANPNQADASSAKATVEDAEPKDLLCAYAWADVKTGTGYMFDADGKLTPTTGEAKAFEVSDSKKSDPETSAYTENGGEVSVTKTVYTFVLSLGGEQAKSAVLTVMEYGHGQATTLTLSSSAFANELAASPKSQSVTIEDQTGSGKIGEAMGDQAKLEAALSTWCQSHAIGTTKASWNGKCAVDYALSTRTVSLTLNNSAKKTVACVLNPDGNYAFYF